MDAKQLFELITVARPTQQHLQQQQQLPHLPLVNILPPLFELIVQYQQYDPKYFLQVMIQLRSCLFAKDEEVRRMKQLQWTEMPFEFKVQVHSILIELLHNLPLTMKIVAETLCEVISIVASYDLPNGQWDELIDQLLVTSISANAQNNCILTLALITEKVSDVDIQRWLPKILPKFVDDVYNDLFARNKLLGLKNMINHRAFAYSRMHEIYGVLTDPSANVKDEDVCSMYLDSLVVTIQECYMKFKDVADEKFYMFLNRIMETHLDNTGMMRKVLDVFCELGKIETNPDFKMQTRNILSQNYQDLFVKLVTIMGRNVKQMFEDDDDEGENQNNVVVVALEIFVFLTLQNPNDFVEFTMTQLNGMLKGQAILQYLGTMIFGRLIEGKAKLEMIGQMFMQLSQTYGQTNEMIIRISAADVIIKMLERYPKAFIPEQINYIFTVTFKAYQEKADVKFVVAACKLLGAFYDNIEDQQQLQMLLTHAATCLQFYQMIIVKNDATCKRNALKSMISFVSWLGEYNQNDKVDEIYKFMLQCIQHFASDAKIVSVCLEVLGECLSANGHKIQQNPQEYDLNGLLQKMYNYLSNQDAYDSALRAIVAIGEVMQEHFAQYLQAVLHHLMPNFSDLSQKDIIEQTCDTIGDLAKGVRSAFQPFGGFMVENFIKLLQIKEIEKVTKIHIIKGITGIAEGLGFEAFAQLRKGAVEAIVGLTQQIMTSQIDLNDEDNAEFYQDYISQVFEFFAALLHRGIPTQCDFLQTPLQIALQMQQLMTQQHGNVSGEVIYSGICYFLNAVVTMCNQSNQLQFLQGVFIPQIMEIVRSADSLVDEIDGYDDLRNPVDDLIEFLKKCGIYQ